MNVIALASLLFALLASDCVASERIDEKAQSMIEFLYQSFRDSKQYSDRIDEDTKKSASVQCLRIDEGTGKMMYMEDACKKSKRSALRNWQVIRC